MKYEVKVVDYFGIFYTTRHRPLLLPLKRPCSLSRTETAISNPKFGVYIIYIYVYVHISHDLKGYRRTTVYPCGACDKMHLKHSVFSFRDSHQALALHKGLVKVGKAARSVALRLCPVRRGLMHILRVCRLP